MKLKDGKATLLLSAERITGVLVLDGRQLRFEPDQPRWRKHTVKLEVVDIKRLDRTAPKVAGVLPFPNGLTVVMRNQETFAFALAGRKAWIEVIGHAQADTPKG